ncbi:MAG: N-acetyl sugar amidotransferase [Bacteroidales bacterium]|nr:N-acetyl sugar amidotransferase [Bacteroidales bacterium]
MNTEPRRCTRCILPESFPGISFNVDGVCSICQEYDKEWGHINEDYFKKSEKKLKRILNNAKKLKRRYDCLVPLSGGKDSTYVLYLCKRVYNLNVLAVNFNNGYQTDEAFQNVKQAANILDVDLIIYKPRWETTKKLTRGFLKATGEGCTPCNVGVGLTISRIAQLEKIPLIMNGISPRSDERSPRTIYASGGEYFMKVVKRNALLKDIRSTIYEDQVRQLSFWHRFTRKITRMTLMDQGVFRFLPKNMFVRNSIPLVIPKYVEWNEDTIFNTIRNELNWKESEVGKEHTDCMLNPLKCYLRHQRWGFGSKTQKYSALIRDGQMDREEALKLITDEGDVPKNLEKVKKVLEIDTEEFESIKQQYHGDYI